MGDSYMTMRNMADICSIKGLKYFRESYISPALEKGLIERLYPSAEAPETAIQADKEG